MTMRRAYETAATLMFSLVLIYLPFYRGLLVAGAGRALLLVPCLSGFHPQPQPVGCCHSPE